MTKTKGDILVFVLESEKWPNGEYRPVFVTVGEVGYKRAKDWKWGDDREIAKEAAGDRNKVMGYTPEEAAQEFMKWA